MKFLEYSPLDKINEFLSDLSLGESSIHATLEAYSCKHSGTDRKLSLSFEHQILDCLGKSSPPDFFLSSRASRKTLIYLLLTLTHMYPDYDFRYFYYYYWEEDLG
ncbi:hypothetical protein GIB67_038553 [Kingdonia uniflora]|uniref:Uncharacterized protein n=1 Tax=Kingdonia uniflora TaxID=39325 RepID=A0A7J7NPF9_9MAGN|nr:hypothetical protein GIB67_038553 [Kingdonia uniflora]